MARQDGGGGGRKRRALLGAYAAAAPDVARGIRAAVATLGPFYFATSLGRSEFAWMALGGWLGTLADPGGTRSSRARALSAFAVLGAAAVAITEACSWSAWLVTIALSTTLLAAALARAVGATAGSVGSLVTIVVAIAGARVRSSPTRDAAFFALGAAQAVLLSSVVWPVWMHLPVRRAIAGVYRELRAYASAVHDVAAAQASPEDPRWTELVTLHHRRIREAIEAARQIALSARARRRGETRVGANVRALLGMAEAQFGVIATLLQEMQALPPEARDDPAAQLVVIMAAYRDVERVLAVRAIHPWAPAPRSRRALSSVTATSTASALAARLVAEACEAADLAQALDSPVGTPLPEEAPPVPSVRSPSRSAALRSAAHAVRDALSWRSIWLEYGIRSAVVGAAAAMAGATFSPEHVHWVTLTAIAVLQPYVGATIKRGIERVIGTVPGSVVAAAVTLTFTSPAALAALMFPLSVAAVATRPRSYQLFTFFLTPVFVLLAERHIGDWWTAAARVGDSALGGAIALVAGVLLLPSSERARLPEVLEEALAAVGGYAQAVLSVDRGAPDASDQVLAARRASGVALSNAETSLERLLGEPLRDRAHAADVMLMVTYARHLSAAVLAVDTLAGKPADPAARARVARYVAEALEAAKAVAHGRRVESVPQAPEGIADAALDRVVRRASLLAGLSSPRG